METEPEVPLYVAIEAAKLLELAKELHKESRVPDCKEWECMIQILTNLQSILFCRVKEEAKRPSNPCCGVC